MQLKFTNIGIFLWVQWLRLHIPNAGGIGLILGWGRSGILHGMAKKNKNHQHLLYTHILKWPRLDPLPSAYLLHTLLSPCKTIFSLGFLARPRLKITFIIHGNIYNFYFYFLQLSLLWWYLFPPLKMTMAWATLFGTQSSINALEDMAYPLVHHCPKRM